MLWAARQANGPGGRRRGVRLCGGCRSEPQGSALITATAGVQERSASSAASSAPAVRWRLVIELWCSCLVLAGRLSVTYSVRRSSNREPRWCCYSCCGQRMGAARHVAGGWRGSRSCVSHLADLFTDLNRLVECCQQLIKCASKVSRNHCPRFSAAARRWSSCACVACRLASSCCLVKPDSRSSCAQDMAARRHHMGPGSSWRRAGSCQRRIREAVYAAVPSHTGATLRLPSPSAMTTASW